MDLKKTLILPITPFEMRGNLNKKEPLILEKWKTQDVFHNANRIRTKVPYVLHDGPPYANGPLHVGHMLNRFIKDFVVRFKNMEGHYTPFRFGWDTHGLPIETAVTKKGLKWREIGISEFRTMCATYALEQVEIQKKTAVRLGSFSDIHNPYITLSKDYEANQIRVFAGLATKGLIYKGLKPVHWSPSSETALAEAEIEYKDIESYEVYVSFNITKGNEFVAPGDKVIIWTTTPWTLPANLGLCLNPDFIYGLYETNLGRFVILPKLVDEVSSRLGLTNVKKINSFKGSELDCLEAKHPFYDRTSLLMNGRYVSDEAGTGIVHIAPGHGLDDYNVCLSYGISAYCPVDNKGVYDDTVGPELSGVFYEKGNEVVLNLLRKNDALLFVNRFIHSYPHDWRTKKPLIFRATPQWFCSIEPIKKDLLKQVTKINWYNSWSKLRMTNMIKDRSDWCISRQRVWGVPIPMIVCEDGTPIIDEIIFENIANEFSLHGSNIWFEKDVQYFLPKGYTNPHSPNGIFIKERDIMDVWFDSGSSFSSVIQKDGFYPADLYLEGSDQYRGWFNSSLILSTATTGRSAFEACASHGFIQDSNGQKMSKSMGNALDPEQLMETFGADILRLWAALSDYTQDVRISIDQINKTADVYKKIRNTFRFMLGNLSNGAPDSGKHPFDIKKDKVMISDEIDKIVLNNFNKIKNNYIKKYRELDFINAINPLIAFFSNELSSFYLDIAKDVLYCDDVDSTRRKSMQNVIYIILTTSIRLLNPILPFTMDEVNGSLTKALATNVQYLRMPSITKVSDSNLGDEFFKLRDKVMASLEQLRQEKLIGSGLDANVVVAVGNKQLFGMLDSLNLNELARVFGVSRCAISLSKDSTDSISVEVSSAEKCERCWNHSSEIIEINGLKLCRRCYDVLTKTGEIQND